jgi:ribonuclease VapC
MFIDACALIALLSEEPEAERVANAIQQASTRFTSPVAVLEAVLGLARPDKFGITVAAAEEIVMEERAIELRDLPPAKATAELALLAAHKYRKGRHGLNLGDCLHYACAKYYGVPILATHGEFSATDLDTVP